MESDRNALFQDFDFYDTYKILSINKLEIFTQGGKYWLGQYSTGFVIYVMSFGHVYKNFTNIG